ncbi:MAG TPA: terpene cyclase/mutase family protein [Polyangiaceae bacterium]|jgi:squalene/oxidosqualene cyclase-like protein|nr:terpene cyclase/mutase family protein [Polyangiaceae bacterium]
MIQASPSDPATGVDLRQRARATMGKAIDNLARLQDDDGGWPGDYGGPLFLLPMYLALCHAMGRVPSNRDGMIAYLSSVQHEDGSVGLHAEDRRGSMFCTSLVYVGLRVLGLPPEDPRVERMRRWIRAHGSPLGAAAWGKFTLCLLGLYDWRGIHPVLPELWLLPKSAPMHPSHFWCHCRQVYLPMAWLYGRRATVPAGELVRALREELYAGEWDRIDWERHRDTLAAGEAYRAESIALRATNRTLDAIERAVPARVRARALAEIFRHVVYEDRVTDFIDIGPVNKVLNTFVHHFQDPGGESARRAFAACDLYLWSGHDGTKMQGYNSSKLWDTAFTLQALLAAGPESTEAKLASPVAKAYGYVRDNQILDDVPDAARHYRHASRGGWPFSNRAHGWPITDCTAEGFKCALALEGRYVPGIPEGLLRDSVRLMLSWQNDDGGWATYECKRGPAWLELLNPSQVFGDIMVDYSYVECTSAMIQALVLAKQRFPDLAPAIAVAIERGAQHLRARQLPDGGFEGSWAVCFTYGAWFGVTGLLAAGARPDDEAVVRACRFLLDRQREDGGWGEHGDSCREHRYIQASAGGVAQTSWALATLVRARHAGHESKTAQRKAVRFLIERQEADGGWAREPLVGVFNRTCLINYDNYRHYFPLWALAEWAAGSEATSL